MTKILVVDDQYSDRELVKDILETQNFTVDTASDGKEAIEKLKKEKYDIVLTDLMMPEIDGLQLIKLIKENNFDTEIIMMTAYATVDTAIEAIKSGVYDYLVKPLNKHKTSVVIKNCLESHKLEKEVEMLQQKVFQMEKMLAISQFSSGIAHQLRNPLFVIQSTASYLTEKYPKDSELQESLNLIIRSSQHADEVIYSLLRTTNFDEVKLEKVSLNEVISETIKLTQLQLTRKNIKMIQELSEDIFVLGNYSYLQQCFLNIIMNSIDAINSSQKDGMIKIKSSFVETSLPQRRIDDKKIDKFVCIDFEDNGKGIPQNVLSKVFEPFFTMKSTGTGLGLFFVYQVIVNCFGGDIRIESAEGKGTKVSIFLQSVEKI